MNFRIRGLEARQFDHLFALSDAELAEHGAVRRIADGPRPCRISLSDAKPGDELILVNYEHHAVSSPYRMRFAIYIRRGEETFDAIGEVPEQLRKRTLAVRGFDAAGMMTGREIVEGTDLEAAIARQFANVEAQYLHIHFICTSISPRPAATLPASTASVRNRDSHDKHRCPLYPRRRTSASTSACLRCANERIVARCLHSKEGCFLFLYALPSSANSSNSRLATHSALNDPI